MPKFSGRKISVGFGKEATRGTAVAPAMWYPRIDMDFDEKTEVVENESSIGVIIDAVDTEIVRRYSEGPIGGNFGINAMSLPLYALFGAVTTTEDSTGAYKHSFSLVNTNERPTLTVAMHDPVKPYRFPMAVIKKIKLKYEQNKNIDVSMEWVAKKGEADTGLVPAFGTEYYLMGRHTKVRIAELIAGLAGGADLCIKSANIEIDLKTEEEYCLGNDTPCDFLNVLVSVSGTIEATYKNEEDYKNVALSGSTRAIRLNAVNEDVTIGASSHPTFSLTLGKIKFTEWAKKMGNNEIVTQTCKIKYLGNGTDLLCDLVNTTPTI